jgi:hypothetical protein
MEELGKFTLLVTAFVIAVSMVEAVWLTRKNRNTATPFAWHEV